MARAIPPIPIAVEASNITDTVTLGSISAPIIRSAMQTNRLTMAGFPTAITVSLIMFVVFILQPSFEVIVDGPPAHQE